MGSVVGSREMLFCELYRGVLHYGSKSLRGTQVAALFYTLCESAKLGGVDPHTYLLTATDAALAAPGTVTLPTAATA